MRPIAAPRSELHDSLDTDAQGLKLLPDYVFRHVSAKVFKQQTKTTILWEREIVKTTHPFPMKESKVTGRGSEAVGIPRHDHESLALHLGRQTAGT